MQYAIKNNTSGKFFKGHNLTGETSGRHTWTKDVREAYLLNSKLSADVKKDMLEESGKGIRGLVVYEVNITGVSWGIAK